MLKLTAGISKAIRILGTRISSAIAKGSIAVQQNTISASYRIRGRVARTHTKMNIKRTALIASAILCRLRKESLLNTSGIL